MYSCHISDLSGHELLVHRKTSNETGLGPCCYPLARLLVLIIESEVIHCINFASVSTVLTYANIGQYLG